MNDDAFLFTLSAEEGTPMPTATELTITNEDTDHIKSFGKIDFIEAGTYTYTVKEVKGANDGITYDSTEHTVTIVVEDNGDGTLVANVDSNLIQTVQVTNTYDASGSVTFQGEKTMTGRALAATDSFEFTITQVDEKGDVVKVFAEKAKAEGASGKIVYPQITYALSDMLTDGTYAKEKTFYYKVTEDIPLDATMTDADGNTVTYAAASDAQKEAGGFSKNGVTYASSAQTFEVKVIDDGKGTLNAVAKASADADESETASEHEPSRSSAGLYKTATNLNGNYDSTVRVKLQGETTSEPEPQPEKKTYDIVFVIDVSQSQGDTATALMNRMFEEAENGGYNVKIGIVKYYYVAKVARYLDGTTGWTGTSGHGTNLPVGIQLGTKLLDDDTSVDAENKYLVVLSDGDTYIYQNNNELNAYKDGNVLRTHEHDTMVVTQTNSGYLEGTPFAGPGSYSWKYHNGNREPEDFAPPENWDDFFARVGPQVIADNGNYQTEWGWQLDNRYAGVENAIPEDKIFEHANSADTSLYYSLINYRAASAKKYHTYAAYVYGGYDRPYGASFMAYLNGGASLDLSKLGDTLADDIATANATQVAKGGVIEDTIGYGYDDKGNAYDMDFVNELETTDIILNGKTLAKEEVDGKFVFSRAIGDEPLFTLTYSGNTGAGNEGYTVQFSDKVLATDTVEMRYNVHLSDPQTKAGTYGNYVETGSPEGVAGLLVSSRATFTREGSSQTFANPVVSYSAIGFGNTYKAEGEATLEAVKAIEGADWPTNGKVTFSVSSEDGPLPSNATAELTEPGSATFGPIKFTEADAGKTYTYTISETVGFGDGWTASGDVTAYVTVTDNENGTLSTAVSYEGGNTITNTYTASGSATLAASKAIEGAAWPAGGVATFTLTGSDNAPMPETTTIDLGSTGTAEFGPIGYTLADVGKTYHYTITETASAGFGEGWASGGTVRATVTVSDNHNGTLAAQVVYDGDNQVVTNGYTASGSITFGGTKTLVGRDLTEDDVFGFTVKEVDGNYSEGASLDEYPVVASGTNQLGDIQFTTINYGLGDLGTHTYVVYEDAYSASGIESSTDTYVFTVEVTDNGDSTLTATPSIDVNELNFTNTYNADTSLRIQGGKSIENRNFKQGDSFTFKLNAVTQGAPMPVDADGNVLDEITITPTADDAASTTFSFAGIKFTQADDNKTYTYKVTESANVAGVQNNISTAEHTVTVAVHDDGMGNLTATATYADDAVNGTMLFVNKYDASGTFNLGGTKFMEGRDFREGDFFTFTIAAAEESDANAPMPASKEITVHPTSDDQNSIGYAFGDIAYSRADANKTYVYVVTEALGSIGGVTYDNSTYKVTVKVTDDGNGNMVPNVQSITKNGAAVETSATALDFTNTYEQVKTEATIVKVWNDNENQDGKRPEKLEVTLNADNVAQQTVELSEANGWTATVDNLPKYQDDDSTEIVYTWTEGAMPEGYALTDTSIDGTVTTLTNTRGAETTHVTVVKVWDDNENQDGKRPDDLKVKLLADGKMKQTVTLSDDNNWTATVTDLPVNDKGQQIKYTWEEESLPTGYELTSSATNGLITTLTNKHAPETTAVTVKKVWDDADNQDGKRPEKLEITLNADNVAKQTVELSEDNDWTATVENLPVYAAGQKIFYTWSEGKLPDGYTLTGDVTEGTVTTLTNSHTTAETEATVTKVWDDSDNQDGKRPEKLEVTLNADNVAKQTVELSEANGWTYTVDKLPKFASGKEIVYTWAEGDLPEGYTLTSTKAEGTVTTLTNTHAAATTDITVKKAWADADNQDGIRPTTLTVTLLADGVAKQGVTLTAADGWTATVTDLPKFKAGQEIAYTWAENSLPKGYELVAPVTVGTTTTLGNAHKTELTEATVQKVWNDANDNDGKRPEKLEVTLNADNEAQQTVELSEANGWKATVDNLPKFKAGKEIAYTWTEGAMPEGYTLTSTKAEGTVTTLTNSYDTEVTEATVKKVWDDADNRDGLRPGSLTVALSNGTEVTLSEANGWTATVDNLPAYDNGQKIAYTWTEVGLPEGYELTGTVENGTITTLTNTHEAEVTKATVKKVWDDSDNQDGKRPESIVVALSDGTEVALSEANGWQATIENLPANRNGEAIAYTWSEVSMPEGYMLTGDTAEGTVTTLTNSYTAEQTQATVKKVWDDADNNDGKRPASLTVTLNADGVAKQSFVLSEDNGWTATIENLPAYAAGQKIAYTWSEGAMPEGYTLAGSTAEGTVTTLTNKHSDEVVAVSGKKTWNDVASQVGDRPESITVHLLADGVEVDSTTVTAADDWAYSFEDLPKFKAGEEIVYTVAEDAVENYVAQVNGYNLVNTHIATAEVQFFAQKKLEGAARTLRAGEFSFELLEDGQVIQTAVNAGDGNARFAAIEYTTDDTGVHSYTIREVKGDLKGVTYDTAAYDFKVTVTDNGNGTLDVAYDGYNPDEGVAFTNTYAPSGSVALQVNKLLDGAAPAAGAYTFQVADLQGSVYTTAKNAADGTVTFPSMTFKAAGTYKYVISEVVPATAQPLGTQTVADGIAYDTHKVNVTIEAIDNFDGTLRFDTTYEDNDVTFENATVADATYPLTATKHIEGRDFVAGDSFTFTVTADEGAPLPENTQVTIQPTSGTDAVVDFGAITFTTADLGKTYTYTISEADAAETVNGLQNDPFAHWVKLTVNDAGDGTMTVLATYQNDASGIVLTNRYTATGQAQLTATKVLEGRELADSEFFFELSGGNLESPLHANAAADGSIAFAPITYTMEDVGKSFTYTMTETAGALGGVMYDTSSYDVTVTVTDNGDGTLGVAYDYGEAGAAPVFRNTYKAAGTTAQLTAHKALTGGTLAGDEFSFTLTGVSENAAGTAQTVKNDAKGMVTFDAIDYDTPGVYEYRIAEVIPAGAADNGDGTFTAADGIVYDGSQHTAVVTVTDDGHGALKADVAYDDNAAGISFGNAVGSSVSTGFEFDKYYFGGVGTFDFTLTATDAQGVARAGAAVDYTGADAIVDDGQAAFTVTVQNGALSGNMAKVVFPEITYTADGDYYYLVQEAESSTPDMVADAAQYLAHVVVKDGQATTTFELIYEGVNYGPTTDLSFYNNSAVTLGFASLSAQSATQLAQRVSVYPKAKKQLNGSTDQLVGGEFTFELVDEATGDVIAVATNDELGNVAFFDENTDPGLAYDEPGAYYYYIREVPGNELGMIYDDSTVLLTVVIDQQHNELGEVDGLVATVTYNAPGLDEEGYPIFYNVKEGMDLTVQKVSRYGGEGLVDCTYALWMHNENGADVMVKEATSDENGFITFTDVALMAGQKYFFKEVEAPEGHTVDPYRTAYFSLNETGDALVLVEETAPDGWHSAVENIELDKARASEASE